MKTLAMITLIGLIGLACFVTIHIYAHVYTDDGEWAHPATEPGSFDNKEGYGNILGFVYGRAVATAHYEWPMATGLHSAYINNYSGGLPEWPNQLKGLRFYVDFESRISGPHRYNDSDEWHHDGWLDSYWSNNPDDRPGYWWVDNEHLDFDLTDQRKGRFDLEADSVLTAKYDIDGDGIREIETWPAEAKLERFLHQRPNLGVE